MRRLRVSALALTEDALRPRAEFHSATEPPTLQFPQQVGLVTPSVKIDKRFRQLPQGGSQADDDLSFEQTLASFCEGGGFALAKSEGEISPLKGNSPVRGNVTK